MKKIIIPALLVVICSCSNNTINSDNTGDSANVTYDVTEADTSTRGKGSDQLTRENDSTFFNPKDTPIKVVPNDKP